jgi:hypothetical protein
MPQVMMLMHRRSPSDVRMTGIIFGSSSLDAATMTDLRAFTRDSQARWYAILAPSPTGQP